MHSAAETETKTKTKTNTKRKGKEMRIWGPTLNTQDSTRKEYIHTYNSYLHACIIIIIIIIPGELHHESLRLVLSFLLTCIA
jgi:hypothetical protein